jgi:multiple sugar transport system substrate-binding protein
MSQHDDDATNEGDFDGSHFDASSDARSLAELREQLPENLVVEPRLSRAGLLKAGALGGLAVSSLGLARGTAFAQSTAASEAAMSAAAQALGPAAKRAVAAAKKLGLSNETTGILFSSGTRDQIEPAAKLWTKLTGIKINLIEQPQAQQFQRIQQEGIARTGGWAIGVIWPRMLADVVSAGSVADISAWVTKYNPQLSSGPQRVFEPLVAACKINGKFYALPTDGDEVISAGRSDIFNDPKLKAGFENKYGYPLAAPKSWKQYDEMAHFLHFKRPGVYGAVELRDILYGSPQFLARWCSKATPFAYWFKDDMTPLVNSPSALAAGVEYVKLRDVMHKDILNWGFTETYGAWAKGQAALTVSWPSVVKFANIPSLSKIVGKQFSFRLPGSVVKGKVNYKDYQSAGNSYTINTYWKGNKEAAYLFAQFLIDPVLGSTLLMGSGFFDPYRYNHLTDKGVVRLYTKGQMGVNGPLIKDVKAMAPDIVLKGSGQYIDALSRNLSAAYSGQTSIQKALDATADAWNKTTDQQGRDKQIEGWKSLKKAYPRV